MSSPKLKRNLSFWLITFYGLGTILGAGIYVLVGKVAGEAGMFAPVSFLIAAVIATFTGLSYAELSSRFPKAAGEVNYTMQGFHQPWLSTFVGALVIITGIVSAATISKGVVGYLNLYISVSEAATIILFLLILGELAIWGTKESAIAVTFITLCEIGGLLLVIFTASDSISQLPTRIDELIPPLETSVWSGVLLGSFLAFYAYIGFEDMVNMSEEVKDPRRTMPLAIITAVIISTVLYILIAVVATLSLPVETLSNSEAPFADIMQSYGHSSTVIGLISLLAIGNGALVQIIMVSRVLYGMAQQKLIPQFFAHINATTHTPIISTVIVTICIFLLALLFPLTQLAKMTSFVVLCIFIIVNISLIAIKRNNDKTPVVSFPIWVPIIGCILCVSLLAFQINILFK